MPTFTVHEPSGVKVVEGVMTYIVGLVLLTVALASQLSVTLLAVTVVSSMASEKVMVNAFVAVDTLVVAAVALRLVEEGVALPPDIVTEEIVGAVVSDVSLPVSAPVVLSAASLVPSPLSVVVLDVPVLLPQAATIASKATRLAVRKNGLFINPPVRALTSIMSSRCGASENCIPWLYLHAARRLPSTTTISCIWP